MLYKYNIIKEQKICYCKKIKKVYNIFNRKEKEGMYMKKLQTLFIVVLMVLVLGTLSVKAFATNGMPLEPESLTLSADQIRPFSDDGIAAGNPDWEDGIANNGYIIKRDNLPHTVFKIGEVVPNSENLDYRKALYCARFAVDFGEARGYYYQEQKYEKVGNLNKDVSTIVKFYNDTMNNNEIDQEVTSLEIDGRTYQFRPYNALLWLVDNMAQIKGNVNYGMEAEDYAQINTLLEKAGLGNLADSKLTIDDIDVIQQIAVWYFTNYDEEFKTFNIMSDLKISKDGSEPPFNVDNKLDDLGAADPERVTSIETLYNYLINNAIKNASNYGTGDVRPAGLGNMNLPTVNFNIGENIQTVEFSGQQYDVIGPMTLEVSGDNLINFSNVGFKAYINGNQIATNENSNGYMFLKPVGNGFEPQVPNNVVMENSTFYFARPHTNEIINSFKMDITYTCDYEYRTGILYKNKTTQGGQPVIYTIKEAVSEEASVTDSFNNERPDFALRKYITQVNGKNVALSREPRLNEEDLAKINVNGTADYRHRKDAVEVMPGDTVTYTITVYNEGNVPGKVTKILDRLPNGIDVDIDATNALAVQEGKNYTATKVGNDVEITIKERAELPAFNGTTLSNYSVKVVCKVSEELAQTEEDQEFTNIAQITAFTVNGTPMTEDIDSQVNGNGYNNKPLAGYWGKDGQTETRPGASKPTNYYEGTQDDDDFEKLVIPGTTLKPDFALRKYITAVDGVSLPNADKRVPKIDVSNLQTSGTRASTTTAEYKHRKDAVEVRIGETVEYTIAVYNEGEVEGRVTKIIDRLPAGLKLNSKQTEALYNEKYICAENKNGDIVITITDTTKLAPFTSGLEEPDKIEVKVVCDVLQVDGMDLSKDIVLTNIAQITEYEVNGTIVNQNNEKGLSNLLRDRDSFVYEEGYNNTELTEGYIGNSSNGNLDPKNPESYFEGMQDDDDFEKVIIKGVRFDLALRKFITAVERNGHDITIESRVPEIELAGLRNGTSTTAVYHHPKIDEPVVVKNGDIVTYTLRVYNEGDVDGYADLITDHLPEGTLLEFITDSEINTKFGWEFSNDLSTISTKYWERGQTPYGEKVDGKLLAYDRELTKENVPENEYWQQAMDGNDGLYYRDVQIQFKVVAPNNYSGSIINIAEIADSTPVGPGGDPIDVPDPDSPNPVDPSNPGEPGGYPLEPDPSHGQEDDDDYEIIQLKYFDLALRKFITGINNEVVTSRIPNAEWDSENGKIKYVHGKDPVVVSNGDIVTYTIRVYNEGSIAGYAEEVADDIPVGLVYLPEHPTNIQYRWQLAEKDGTNRVVTDYLSEAHGETMKENAGDENPNLIAPFDFESPISNVRPYNPDFRDVKIAFQVDQSALEDPETVVVNHAQITDDSDDDDDSTPDEWNDGDDDQDIEKIRVRIFDLSLQKWVTHTIMTVDGETTVVETGFMPNVGHTDQTGRPNSENEPLAQVVIDKKKLDRTEIKFIYAIKVSNEGEIPGYATEITDYIPEGLMFVEADNPLWTKVGDDKVVTHALETELLNPGDSRILEIVFTWINNENNLGVKRNIAAITGDYNEAGDTPDRDSTPGNTNTGKYEGEQEDDDDFALVILSLKTGGEKTYIAVTLVALAIIATGAFFIKRFVLE